MAFKYVEHGEQQKRTNYHPMIILRVKKNPETFREKEVNISLNENKARRYTVNTLTRVIYQ